ncbi:MAG TPA: serine--tRNA ligase [Dehalococcoidia bacterium]|jgi:seryl-tRNA synthetase|nr:serine--tRNA ligase [Dehalococcoidia bacterium]
MLSIQFVRENPEAVRQALARRNTEAPLDEALALDSDWRRVLTEVEALRAERNALSKEVGELSRLAKGADTKEAKHAEHRRSDLVAKSSFLGERLEALETEVKELEKSLRAVLYEIPNIPAGDVPDGPDESANVVVRQSGEPQAFDFEPKPHWEIGEALDIIDFERGVKLAGSRFFLLKGAGARLQRALIAWMLDYHTSRGYTEVYPPAMIKEDNLWAGGWLPKFGENMYHDAEEDYWLLPTAEVALTNMHRDEVLEPGTLPINYVAYTPCFRREKMSAGRDVRGMKRVHQFDKVEMYKFVEPEQSEAALEELVADAEAVCRELKIAHRVVQICTGDLGFNAAKAFDPEMWAPGSGEWLEVSSCSNCTDFQARRANIRFRREKGGKLEHPHTLNGSGLALPRVMIAVLENYQQADGSVSVPEVLRPYMGGLETIARRSA